MSMVVVITGASAGIGEELARKLAEQGHSLVLAARRLEALEQVAKRLPNALAVATDVSRRGDVDRLRDAAIQAYGHVDVWVNNAGRGITRSVLDLTDEDFDEMMAVNVKSALYGIQAIVPHFIERRSGHLINVSSFLGRTPVAPRRSAYNAAKAALNALTTNLRMDLAATHPDIHVSLVMPALVSTGFARNALGDDGAPPPAASSTMGVQTPSDVANVIARVIQHPAAETYTTPASPAAAKRFFDELGAFDPVQHTPR